MKNKYLCVVAFMLITVVKALAQPAPLANASWISRGDVSDVVGGPCPVLFKQISLNKPVKSARLWVTAHGLYEAKINGKGLTDNLFNPGFTAYKKRLQYQVYDVASLLHANSNDLRITLADGWWRGAIYATTNIYGEDLSLLCNLQVTYTDGTTANFYSDASWQSAIGPIRIASLYDGETYDRTREKLEDVKPVKVRDFDKQNLVPTSGNPVKRHEIFEAKRLDNGKLDFGQNIAGWARLKLHGKKGDTVRIKFAEVLDQKGELFTVPLRNARATDTYVLGSDQPEGYEPYFTYHGFRYAQITWIRNGKPYIPTAADYSIQAVALYSDIRFNGTFACSDERLNKLHQNVVWSMKGNFFDIPTDCPQRAERIGWTEDADVFCSTACYLADVSDFYDKWLADLRAEQMPSGCVPVTIPSIFNRGTDFGCAGWSDAAVRTPWSLYQHYGDTTVLSKSYASMKAWIAFVEKVSPKDRWTTGGFGDWLPSGPRTDLNYLNQCYWYRNCQIMVKVATLLNKSEDVVAFQKLADRIKAAWTKDWADHVPQTQTAYVIGLRFGLLPDSTINNLVRLVHANNDHLSTGFMGTPNLLSALSENGQTDLAYKLLFQDTMPSWLYMVKNDATTMWEKWDGIAPNGKPNDDVSFNHYAFGSVGNWLYENVAGIQPADPGYKKILIAPKPGGGLTWAKGSYRSQYGLISVDWKVTGSKLAMKVAIPKGTTATVIIPGGQTVVVGAGFHQFTGAVKV